MPTSYMRDKPPVGYAVGLSGGDWVTWEARVVVVVVLHGRWSPATNRVSQEPQSAWTEREICYMGEKPPLSYAVGQH